MCAIKNHDNKDALIAELRSKHPYTPFSEESTQMVHTMGNLECFEVCVECDCGACLVPTGATRELNRDSTH